MTTIHVAEAVLTIFEQLKDVFAVCFHLVSILFKWFTNTEHFIQIHRAKLTILERNITSTIMTTTQALIEHTNSTLFKAFQQQHIHGNPS